MSCAWSSYQRLTWEKSPCTTSSIHPIQHKNCFNQFYSLNFVTNPIAACSLNDDIYILYYKSTKSSEVQNSNQIGKFTKPISEDEHSLSDNKKNLLQHISHWDIFVLIMHPGHEILTRVNHNSITCNVICISHVPSSPTALPHTINLRNFSFANPYTSHESLLIQSVFNWARRLSILEACKWRTGGTPASHTPSTPTVP